MATEVNELLVEVGDPKLPRRWIINVDSDNASSAQIIKESEQDKRHWISEIKIVGKPEDSSKCWLKILAGNDKIIGPIKIVFGIEYNIKFSKPICVGEDKELKIQTEEDFDIWLLIDGHTDAYGDYYFDVDPENNSTDVSTTKTLTWSTAAFIDSCNVYFGTNSGSLEFITNTSENTYDPDLSTNTTYYWRIDCIDGSNVYTGDIMTFTTGEEP